MSLQERLREGLYDSKGRPRLYYARNYFQQFGLDVGSNFKELQDFYFEWRNFDEYLVLQKQMENLRVKGKIERKTIATKCSKRGNDVYWWRVSKRFKPIYSVKTHPLFDPHSNLKSTNVVFVTLTYNVGRSTIREAWETVGKEFNKWIRILRKKFGRASCLRAWEASARALGR